jgi:hypothetical protein
LHGTNVKLMPTRDLRSHSGSRAERTRATGEKRVRANMPGTASVRARHCFTWMILSPLEKKGQGQPVRNPSSLFRPTCLQHIRHTKGFLYPRITPEHEALVLDDASLSGLIGRYRRTEWASGISARGYGSSLCVKDRSNTRI